MAEPRRELTLVPMNETENTLVKLLSALALRAGGEVRLAPGELIMDGDFAVEMDDVTGELIVSFAPNPPATAH